MSGVTVHLTNRDHEILRLLAEGMTNKAIGDRLGLADQTVRHQLQYLYHQVGVHTRNGLVAWAFRQGVVQ